MRLAQANGRIFWFMRKKFFGSYFVFPLRAVRKGRVAATDPGRGAVDVLEEQLAHRGWALREAPDHRVDGIVAQPGEEARFPIVECPSRIRTIEHPVELSVGHWTDRIEGRRPELLERPHCFCAGLK